MDQETNILNTQADAALSASGVELPHIGKESAKALDAPNFSLESECTFMDVTEQLQEFVEKLQLQDKTRMSGAARKRLKWLLKQGLDMETARKRAMEPIAKSDNLGAKRPRSDGSTPEAQVKRRREVEGGQASSNASVLRENAPIAPSFKQALEGKKIGIFSVNYPEDSLTTEQMNMVQEAILMKIIDLDEGSIKPKFLGTTFKAGWLTINCANEDTANWLKQSIGSITPWEGARLKAAEDLPKAVKINAFFPNSAEDNNEKILKLVGKQNDGLKTSQWRVLKRTQEGVSAHLTLSIDKSSQDVLKARGHRISYKFGQVTMRDKSAKKPQSRQTPTTSKGKICDDSKTASHPGIKAAKKDVPMPKPHLKPGGKQGKAANPTKWTKQPNTKGTVAPSKKCEDKGDAQPGPSTL